MDILYKLLKYYFFMILIFFTGRVLLFIRYFDNFKDADVNYYLTFIYGLRMDTITASLLLVLPLILLTLSPNILKNIVNTFLKYYFLLIFVLIIYIENTTFPFIAQYDMRPNYLFVEYLIYPKEVFAMIFAAYKLELFIAFLIISAFIYYYLKKIEISFLNIFETSYLKRIVVFIPILLVLFIGIRSSFGHRSANPSDAMYTTNRMVNEITKNSLHSIVYALYVNTRHGSEKIMKQYPNIDTKEAISRVQKRLNIQAIDEFAPFSRLEKTHFKTQTPKNFVIFVQESLGYQFVSCVGGEEGITPELNALSKEGILFKDLYSNGTRSIRGLAGLAAGNFSIPGKGVLGRNKSQSDFYTLASSLKPLGYHSTFMYGGESRFDNMKSWFVGNGFDEIIEQTDFIEPSFVSSWGVCDEDLVVRANEEFKKMHKNKQKFATVMFSQSNHSPFHFPENKIELVDGVEKHSVKNAVKYADYAIGEFFRLAKKEDYYKDTVFVVVADHNVRVYGDDVVPVKMFHIPALILGTDIKPLEYENISSQPDVLATVLDLLGLDLQYPIMGHSIFSDKKQDISFMKFHDTFALRVKDKVAIVQANKEVLTFRYENLTLVPIIHDEELENDAIAFVRTLDNLYNAKKYI